MIYMILDGQKLAESIQKELKQEITALHLKTNTVPGLAVVVVGDDPASLAYVAKKKVACEEIGIISSEHRLPQDTKQDVLNKLIQKLNHDPKINGILLQMPIPKHLDPHEVIALIAPEKDVDGLHPINMGKLALGLPAFKPCTPLGVMTLLQHYSVPIERRQVVIIGRSMLVGKPLAMMLMQANATVTVCHSKTADLKHHTRMADILIAAIGKPYFVTAAMIKEGAVVVDVGINKVEDSTSPRGYRLVGDVDYKDVAPKTHAITPVPKGIGPMTIAMLMQNTVTAFKQQHK